MDTKNNDEYPSKEVRLLTTGTVKYTVVVNGVKVRLQNHSLELWHVTDWIDGWYPHDTLIYRVRAGSQGIVEGRGTSFETAGNDLEDRLLALGWQDIEF